MAGSERLRLRDVRAAFRLIGECVELGADSGFWAPHLFEGLCKLTGGVGAHGGETEGLFTVDPEVRLLSIYIVGCSKNDLSTFARYMAEHAYLTIDQPIRDCESAVQNGASLATRSHEQLIGMRDWLLSELYNDYFRVDRIDDRMFCYCRVPNECRGGLDLWHSMGMYRGMGERQFSGRERRLARMVYRELQPLMGTRLALIGRKIQRPLSPRQLETLGYLLVGHSEKQIAEKCGLAKSTVNEYVSALYRRYGVNSRAELMALFLRWRSLKGPGESGRQLTNVERMPIDGWQNEDDQNT